MGLLNVIKFANDYNKAKKLLKQKKVDVIKIRDCMDSIQEYINFLRDFMVRIEEDIYKAKELLAHLADKIHAAKKKGEN